VQRFSPVTPKRRPGRFVTKTAADDLSYLCDPSVIASAPLSSAATSQALDDLAPKPPVIEPADWETFFSAGATAPATPSPLLPAPPAAEALAADNPEKVIVTDESYPDIGWRIRQTIEFYRLT